MIMSESCWCWCKAALRPKLKGWWRSSNALRGFHIWTPLLIIILYMDTLASAKADHHQDPDDNDDGWVSWLWLNNTVEFVVEFGKGSAMMAQLWKQPPLSSLPHPRSQPPYVGWHQPLSSVLLSAHGVLPKVRGVGGSFAARRSSQPRSQLFSDLFLRLGKGWGCPFCGLWMSRNDGAGGF